MNLSRSVYRYQPDTDRDLPVIETIQAVLEINPGYGFGKSLAENLRLLRTLGNLLPLHRPLLVCTSRKGSLGHITGEKNPKQRLGATLASTLYAVQQGAHMIRVHDVRAARQALRTWLAIAPRGEG